MGAAGKLDHPNPRNVEEGVFDPTTQLPKNTSPDSSSNEYELSSESNESLSDSNESAKESLPVPAKLGEVRNATRCFQRDYFS